MIPRLICVALCALLAFVQSTEGKTLSVEMRFKKADEFEKAGRLKALHEHQVEQLDELADQVEQVAQMISNHNGRSGSFVGGFNPRSSLITAPVQFGNQVFDVTLDTGSTVLWVTSASCTSSACFAHRAYNASQSPTFQRMFPAVDFEIEYGSGNIAGTLARERVGFGDIVVDHQVFGLVTREEGSTFETAQWSGLLGLAYPSLASFEHIRGAQALPFFDSIMAKRVLNHNAFSFWMVRSESNPPMFFLGAPPTNYYSGKLVFADVVDKHYWTIHLEDILVDGKSLGLCASSNKCRAVVDSGTSYMGAPSKDIPAILHELTGDSASAPCQSNLNKTVTYVLSNGNTLTLEPEFHFTQSFDGSVCKTKYIGLDVDPPHGPVHILGEVLFRKYFVHFDRDNDRVGFALARKQIDPSGGTLQAFLMEKLKKMF